MTPTVQMLAAVAVPVVKSPCLIIAPAPIKPIPVITPCNTLAWVTASRPITARAVCTTPQLAMATSAKANAGVLLFARSMPSDRQREDERDQQMDQVL